jgi:hypothetical protein
VVSASGPFHQAFGTAAEDAIGHHVYEIADRRLDLPALRELLERVLPRGQPFERFEVDVAARGAPPRRMVLEGRRIAGRSGAPELILLSFGR